MRSLELQRTARIHRGRLNSMFRLSLLRWLPIIAIVLGLHAILAHAATKPNIVLITLESTRVDRMGFLGAKTKLTPHLDDVARQSMVFEQAYAQAPLTVVSHATILSGLYPQTHRVSEFGTRLASSLPFLPDLLHAQGYHTAAFVGSIALDPKNGFAPGFDRGFDLYDAGFHQPEGGLNRSSSAERPARQVVVRATEWLAHNIQAPFFLWVHLNDPNIAGGASYDGAVAAADAATGKVVAALRASKLYEGALIVIASDHGESLGGHGEETHGVFLYDETIHVPLLVKLPQNQNAGKRVHGRASLVDIAPTVLEIAGVAVPSQMQGQSLLRVAKANPNSDQPVYSMSDFPQRAFSWSALESWRTNKYLYIRAPKPELYDLSTDPSATHNLAQSSKAIFDTMASQLAAFDSHFEGGAKDSGLTSSEMQRLASLGYVGLQKAAPSGAAAVTGTDPKDVIADANKALSAMRALDE